MGDASLLPVPPWLQEQGGNTPQQQQQQPAPPIASGQRLPEPPWPADMQVAPGVAPPPPPIPSGPTASNFRTGLSRGFGGLLSWTQPEAAMYMSQAGINPDDIASAADIREAGTNYALGGQKPYQPQSAWGRIFQNGLADTVEGAPLAALGGGGIPSFLMRQAMNVAGSYGGDILKELFPNHPYIAGLAGSIAGASAPAAAGKVAKNTANTAARVIGTEGAVERQAVSEFGQNPARNMPMSEVDDLLARERGDYWTPGRLDAASEFNKRQAAAKLVPPEDVSRPMSIGTIFQHGLGTGLAGLGLGAGEILQHAMPELPWGLTPGLGGLGLSAGETIGHVMKPYMRQREQIFNRSVQDMLRNRQSDLWQLYQQQQNAPGLASRLGTGFAAPMFSTGFDQQ